MAPPPADLMQVRMAQPQHRRLALENVWRLPKQWRRSTALLLVKAATKAIAHTLQETAVTTGAAAAMVVIAMILGVVNLRTAPKACVVFPTRFCCYGATPPPDWMEKKLDPPCDNPSALTPEPPPSALYATVPTPMCMGPPSSVAGCCPVKWRANDVATAGAGAPAMSGVPRPHPEKSSPSSKPAMRPKPSSSCCADASPSVSTPSSARPSPSSSLLRRSRVACSAPSGPASGPTATNSVASWPTISSFSTRLAPAARTLRALRPRRRRRRFPPLPLLETETGDAGVEGDVVRLPVGCGVTTSGDDTLTDTDTAGTSRKRSSRFPGNGTMGKSGFTSARTEAASVVRGVSGSTAGGATTGFVVSSDRR